MKPVPSVLTLLVVLLAAAIDPLCGYPVAAQDTKPGGIPPSHHITAASSNADEAYAAGLRYLHQRRYADALVAFQRSTKADPNCAMAFLGASRALHYLGRPPEALASLVSAEALKSKVEDRETRFIEAWGHALRSLDQPDAEKKKALEQARRSLTNAIILYAFDPEIWILRAEIETNRLRAIPFYWAALRLSPGHPGRKFWDLASPPCPEVKPGPSAVVGPVQPTPRLFDGLGILSHEVTTRSSQAQAYYEQGLRCFHSYVTPAALQSFQHAANLDPSMPMAYWGLSLVAPAVGGAITRQAAANRALELSINTTDRERRYAAARVLELAGKDSREACFDALDGAIAAYPDDVELWIWRGKALGGPNGSDIPGDALVYQIAANRLRPDHPSPSHELVHGYEGQNRPILGWQYAEGYERSAPNMPHAHHMMAHLATRLGRWDEAIRCTRLSVQKSREGYPELESGHHIDIMIRALAHQGRFADAHAEPKAYRDGLPWARMLRLKGDITALTTWAEQRRKSKSPDGVYIAALVALDRGDTASALPLIEEVEKRNNEKSGDFYRYAETRGRYLVQTGEVEQGLDLLRKAAAKAVKDTGAHAWGGGSYMLEVWGETALRAARLDEAEEAFLEAMAHEHGCIVGALGLEVVSERRKQTDMARHYSNRAATIWKDADKGCLETQLARLRSLGAP